MTESLGVVLKYPNMTIQSKLDKFNDESGRKELINKLRKEMRKGINKEYILKEEDRILINQFIKKLSSELNSVDKN